MRLPGQLARIAAASVVPDTRSFRSRRRFAPTALATLAVLAACNGDTLTSPARSGPTPPAA